MAQRDKSIELLNHAAALEIETVLQYLYFYFHLDDEGYDHLARLFRVTAIKEMDHIERLSQRILYLGGEVIMKQEKEITYIDSDNFDVKKVLQVADDLEKTIIDTYNRFARQAGDLEDSGTKRLLEQLVEMEEEHQDTYQTELDHLNRFGKNYLALQTLQRAQTEADQDKGGTGFGE